MADANDSQAEQNVNPGQNENIQAEPITNQIDRDARMWAMFCHLGGLAGYVIPIIISGVIAPLIIWQIKREDDSFIDRNGKEAVNFQISIAIYALVCIPFIFACIGVFMLAAVEIFNVVFLLIAAIKANNGESYHYPLCIRFIK